MSARAIGMLFCFSSLTASGCASEPGTQSPAVVAQRVATATDTFAAEREAMVDQQIRARGIKAPAVLKAMREVPRHRFVPPPVRHMAYHDQPLPIGSEQTISQPYIVAYMTEAADISPDESVLEIGTGSGYQAAVLGEIAREVYTIEIIPELAERAHNTLAELGYTNVHTKTGNGYLGWPEHAPFDAILVTAAPEQVPQALVDQLALGGRIVVPVGSIIQDMMIIEKTRKGVVERRTIPVRFVPMTGKPRHGDQSDHLLLPVQGRGEPPLLMRVPAPTSVGYGRMTTRVGISILTTIVGIPTMQAIVGMRMRCESVPRARSVCLPAAGAKPLDLPRHSSRSTLAPAASGFASSSRESQAWSWGSRSAHSARWGLCSTWKPGVCRGRPSAGSGNDDRSRR
jgi:protein-L-isoaspartate(D-aspartate) O-methyltransferase